MSLRPEAVDTFVVLLVAGLIWWFGTKIVHRLNSSFA
jgi:hypothetical protein